MLQHEEVMGIMFGRFDVDEAAETVPYTRRVAREITFRLPKPKKEPRRLVLLRVAAFAYFAFAAWTALEYLIHELG